MMTTHLQVSPASYEMTLEHLFSAWDTEHAAFLFAHASAVDQGLVLSVEDQYLVPASGFVRRSAYHFELTDDIQRHVIKEAHSRGCCLVEAHSHPFAAPACFSGTDVSGLHEWVSYVRWRLGGRPYAALVIAPGSFDGLVFSSDNSHPRALEALTVGRIRMRPTGATAENWEAICDGRYAF